MERTRRALVEFMRQSRFGVIATTAANGAPQSAVVGAAVSDELELFFDTLSSTRKYENLRREPRVAFTMWIEEATVQLEGVADEPKGAELERLKAIYFATFPDGPVRETWPGIAYVRVRATWLRYTSFAGATPEVIELYEPALAALT